MEISFIKVESYSFFLNLWLFKIKKCYQYLSLKFSFRQVIEKTIEKIYSIRKKSDIIY